MFDITSFVKTAGYVGVASMVFAESGLLVGFFLPGDSLLFTAGFLSSQGFLDVRTLVVIALVAAVAGDSFGYALGHRIGPQVFKREDSFFFNKRHVTRAEKFYAVYGAKAITIARFMPIVRTFAPTVAGVARMRYSTFLIFNVLGAVLWAVCLPYIGYYAGSKIPNIDSYIGPIVIGILVLSILPGVIHILRHKTDRAAVIDAFKRFINRQI